MDTLVPTDEQRLWLQCLRKQHQQFEIAIQTAMLALIRAPQGEIDHGELLHLLLKSTVYPNLNHENIPPDAPLNPEAKAVLMKFYEKEIPSQDEQVPLVEVAMEIRKVLDKPVQIFRRPDAEDK